MRLSNIIFTCLLAICALLALYCVYLLGTSVHRSVTTTEFVIGILGVVVGFCLQILGTYLADRGK